MNLIKRAVNIRDHLNENPKDFMKIVDSLGMKIWQLEQLFNILGYIKNYM